jgi:hypothetical protein
VGALKCRKGKVLTLSVQGESQLPKEETVSVIVAATSQAERRLVVIAEAVVLAIVVVVTLLTVGVARVTGGSEVHVHAPASPSQVLILVLPVVAPVAATISPISNLTTIIGTGVVVTTMNLAVVPGVSPVTRIAPIPVTEITAIIPTPPPVVITTSPIPFRVAPIPLVVPPVRIIPVPLATPLIVRISLAAPAIVVVAIPGALLVPLVATTGSVHSGLVGGPSLAEFLLVSVQSSVVLPITVRIADVSVESLFGPTNGVVVFLLSTPSLTTVIPAGARVIGGIPSTRVVSTTAVAEVIKKICRTRQATGGRNYETQEKSAECFSHHDQDAPTNPSEQEKPPVGGSSHHELRPWKEKVATHVNLPKRQNRSEKTARS